VGTFVTGTLDGGSLAAHGPLRAELLRWLAKAGHVVGLVGLNGAGKTTLLNLATGMVAPTTGTIAVLGGRPAAGPAQLARVGYLAQDAPVYPGLSVAAGPAGKPAARAAATAAVRAVSGSRGSA
jgi:ABC-type cobalamin/Fe3+-siderophores transport system ATPase subunit